MAYEIDFSQDEIEGFYAEFAFVNLNNGQFIDTSGVEHQLVTYGDRYGYGDSSRYSQILASNSDGLITSPERGVICVSVPSDILRANYYPGLGVWYDAPQYSRQMLRCRLLAVPSNTALTKTLANIRIYFGERGMANPRVMLSNAPLYPNSLASSGGDQTLNFDYSTLGYPIQL